MIRLPPKSTRTDTLLPDTTLFLSDHDASPATRCAACWRPARPDMPRQPTSMQRTVADRHATAKRHPRRPAPSTPDRRQTRRSEEHTSELQSLMRISYAVFCLKKKTNNKYTTHDTTHIQQKEPQT